jgi:hypothetical protein
VADKNIPQPSGISPVALMFLIEVSETGDNGYSKDEDYPREPANWLSNNGLITTMTSDTDVLEDSWVVTDRGTVFLQHLLSQPLPVPAPAWKMP